MNGTSATVTRRLGDAALRNAAKVWLPHFQADLDQRPRAVDRARQQVLGPGRIRVLIIGNGIANAFGVRTADLALPASLARALRDSVGRGIEVDLDAGRGMRVGSIADRIDTLRVWRYDAVILTVGQTDAGAVLPVEAWRASMRELLTRLQVSLRPSSVVLALSLVPVLRASARSDWLLDRIEAYATRLDEATQEVIDELPWDGVQLVPLRPVLGAAGELQFASAAAYSAIALHLADLLTPRLCCAPETPDDAGDADEDTRLAALAASGLLDAQPSERLVRLVRSARTMFGVRAATLTLVGRDHLRVVTQSGVNVVDDPPRAGTLVGRILHAPGMFELSDVPSALNASLPVLPTGDVRFYAGLAIESPSGHRIGALCLFDDRPRSAGTVDEAALRELVSGVQAELWDTVSVSD